MGPENFISASEIRCPNGTLLSVAQVAELVDALVSGTSAERRGGSSPLLGTKDILLNFAKKNKSKKNKKKSKKPLLVQRLFFRAMPQATSAGAQAHSGSLRLR